MQICFVDKTTSLDTLDDLKHRARGGMVSSLRILPDVLSKLGHRCFVISDVKQGGVTSAGTRWYTDGRMRPIERLRQYDILVYNRQLSSGLSEIRAKKRVLWTHDLPHSGFVKDPKMLNAIDKVVFMSRFAENIWRKYYPGIKRSVRIPNGVDKTLFYPREKDLNYIIFASAPNRGLKWLPMIYGNIRAKIGDRIYCRAYSDMQAMHPDPKDTRIDGHWIDSDYRGEYYQCAEYGIERLMPVPQPELAEQLGRAGLMIMPTEFPEICSNSILQALASGVPVITTGQIGSAGEWVKHKKTGFLTEYHPHDYFVCFLEMARFAVRMYEKPKLHLKMTKNAARTKIHTWQQIGRKWDGFLRRL